MGTASKYVKNAIVFYDDAYPFRWLDAIGDGVIKYVPSVGTPTDDTTGEPTSWINTETGTNTWVNSSVEGELWTITTGATEYNGYSSQIKGQAFVLASGKPFYIGGLFKLSVADQSDFLFGLAALDTTLTAASSAHAIAVSGDGLFFSKIDPATAIKANVYVSGASSASVSVDTAADTSYHRYEIISEDGESAKFYFDNVLITTITDGLPTGTLTPSFSVRNGASAAVAVSAKGFRAIQVLS